MVCAQLTVGCSVDEIMNKKTMGWLLKSAGGHAADGASGQIAVDREKSIGGVE